MLSPKEVVKKWVDAFNAGDVDMIVSLYDNNDIKVKRGCDTILQV